MTEGLGIIRQNNFPERKVEEERIDKVETELNSISPQVKMRKTELSCCANYREGNKANCLELDGTPRLASFCYHKVIIIFFIFLIYETSASASNQQDFVD